MFDGEDQNQEKTAGGFLAIFFLPLLLLGQCSGGGGYSKGLDCEGEHFKHKSCVEQRRADKIKRRSR